MEMISDIPRIYTALAECIVCFLTVFMLDRKISNRRILLYFAGMLVFQSVFLELTDDVPFYLWVPCMAVAVLNMFFFLWLCVDLNIRTLIYYCAEGFLLAEFAASLEWQIASFLYPSYNEWWFQLLILAIIYGLIFFVTFSGAKQLSKVRSYFEVGMGELVVVLLIAILSFTLSNLSFLVKGGPFVSAVTEDIYYIRTLVDLLGTVILYAYESQICEAHTQIELNLIRSALKEQYNQYRNYQTSMELMHIKYHDLKHQIAGLRTRMTQEQREEWIAELEREIEDLEPAFRTGSSVLDTIIAGKLMTMRPNQIHFTCVADGKLLEYIHITDLCTIFGNALDNAIESVALVENVDKRLIHLSVSKQRNFIYIRISNYCDHVLHYRNGYPKTTKPDSGSHGFGLKSIRYSVDKYNGNLSFGVKEHWFNLEILIPLNNTGIGHCGSIDCE